MTAFADKLSPAFQQQVLGDPALNCPPSLIMSSTAVPDASSGGDSDDNTELIVAVVALVISVLAFVIAILQALQQYLGTATGFSSCSEAVIGKWAQFARRQMLWTEFRFEVQFETPVIFVAKPGNTRGPLGDDALAKEERQKIIRLDGGHDNFKYTDTVQEYDDKYRQSTQQVVHTADNEKATWLALLMAIVRMEKESREWQGKKTSEWRKATGPRPPLDTAVAHEQPAAHHSLLVCMQRKRRTWDSMPKDFAKPYATTTISHIVEIAAMLGIHWRQFDLNNDQYRAQGNGFVLYGSYTDGLGICFNIQKQGPTWFEKNRIVPSYNVKQLCFGMAPTILYRDRKVYADEAKGAETLQLGSLSEIAKTLVVLGCDINTVNYFRKNTDQARHSHLFASRLPPTQRRSELTLTPNSSIRDPWNGWRNVTRQRYRFPYASKPNCLLLGSQYLLSAQSAIRIHHIFTSLS